MSRIGWAAVDALGGKFLKALNRGTKILQKLRRGAKAGRALGKLIRHHTVPREILRKLPPNIARSGRVRGMRECRNVWEIPKEVHDKIHKGARGGPWNKAWRTEIMARGGYEAMDAETIVEIRELLVHRFGLARYRP